ncbi:muconolactone delta-isomerase [Kribbella rubisoli]|jgi:muconolactone D-isomerase|uniref:Muconolactone Delta-isomerase n=1 Tax=Kribbella rubisoli TaxID=3075929 RepID=A0A4Q7X0Z6_9ACTN|nr:muconolactone Delta-isomerase [Kribbella rubisoli]RZU15779.1 muconolactone delta-isomerase [Kribbella rubisoli]
MFFHVRMDVQLPPGLDAAPLLAQEKARAAELQRSGVWPGLWRVVGEYANISIFDVPTNDDLHEILSSLPLFPYMKIHVTPLATHPSKI